MEMIDGTREETQIARDQILTIIKEWKKYNEQPIERDTDNNHLTTPDFVLTPEAEGVIRGGSTAAVRELANYMKIKGREKLISVVLSQLSAIVKNKLGFHYKNY